MEQCFTSTDAVNGVPSMFSEIEEELKLKIASKTLPGKKYNFFFLLLLAVYQMCFLLLF